MNKDFAKVTSSKLTFRSSPKISKFNKLDTLKKNEVLKILDSYVDSDTGDTWYALRHANLTVGWAMKTNRSKSEDYLDYY